MADKKTLTPEEKKLAAVWDGHKKCSDMLPSSRGYRGVSIYCVGGLVQHVFIDS